MSAQNPSRDTANLWVYVPFVAAVIGTVVMLFTNSANALKVALIFALWAGAAGILLNSKVRRDRDAAEDEARAAEQRAREQEERHRAELQAAPAAPAAPAPPGSHAFDPFAPPPASPIAPFAAPGAPALESGAPSAPPAPPR